MVLLSQLSKNAIPKFATCALTYSSPFTHHSSVLATGSWFEGASRFKICTLVYKLVGLLHSVPIATASCPYPHFRAKTFPTFLCQKSKGISPLSTLKYHSAHSTGLTLKSSEFLSNIFKSKSGTEVRLAVQIILKCGVHVPSLKNNSLKFMVTSMIDCLHQYTPVLYSASLISIITIPVLY